MIMNGEHAKTYKSSVLADNSSTSVSSCQTIKEMWKLCTPTWLSMAVKVVITIKILKKTEQKCDEELSYS